MLWTMLTLMSSTTFIASAVLSAKHANAGPGMYALTIIVGVLLGGCNAWAMYKVAGTIESRSKTYSESLKEWCFRALYFAAVVWVPLAAFFGKWVTSGLLRLTV